MPPMVWRQVPRLEPRYCGRRLISLRAEMILTLMQAIVDEGLRRDGRPYDALRMPGTTLFELAATRHFAETYAVRITAPVLRVA